MNRTSLLSLLMFAAPHGAAVYAQTPLQCDPRTPITQSQIPLTITRSGSYYLRMNLQGPAGLDAITVATDSVSIDLNGFSIVGEPGSLSAVAVSGSRRNLVIHNGIITGFGSHGVNAALGINCRLERLELISNGTGGSGHGAIVSDSSSVSDCLARFNSFHGITTGQNCVVTNCVAANNGSDGLSINTGSTVKGCTALSSGSDGIAIGEACVAVDCVARQSTASGFDAGQGCLIASCTSSDNLGDGIVARAGGTVQNCTVGKNGGHGITAQGLGDEGRITDCTATNNSASGIFIDHSSWRIAGNHCVGNGHAGIRIGPDPNAGACHIESNTVIRNGTGLASGRGILVETTNGKSLVIKNHATLNGLGSGAVPYDYDVHPSHVLAEIIDNPVSGFSVANPWANVSIHN